MDEERKTWAWGTDPATGLAHPVDAVTGEPFDYSSAGSPKETGLPRAHAAFRLSNWQPALPPAIGWDFPQEGGSVRVDFTLEDMQALQRVARAQIEMEKRRGSAG